MIATLLAVAFALFIMPNNEKKYEIELEERLEKLNHDIEKKNSTIANFQKEINRLNEILTYDEQILQQAITANNEYVISKFEYLKWMDDNSKKLFKWQLLVLYLISFLTLAVVGFAIVHAVRELSRSLPRDPTLRGRALDLISVEKIISENGLSDEATKRIYDGMTDSEGKVTNFTFGSAGVTVASAASWVLVLVIAFAYLYVFVTEVMKAETITFGTPSIDHPEESSSPNLASSSDPNAVNITQPNVNTNANSNTDNNPCSGEACDPAGE